MGKDKVKKKMLDAVRSLIHPPRQHGVPQLYGMVPVGEVTEDKANVEKIERPREWPDPPLMSPPLKDSRLELSPSNDDVIVIKVKEKLRGGEADHIIGLVKMELGDDVRVLVADYGTDIEFIPRRERHYGILVKCVADESTSWMESGHGEIYNTTSLAVARAQLDWFNAGFYTVEIREFNDDGTPGEVVE